MRTLILGLVGASALTVASAASAAITIGSITPGTNPYSGPAPTFTFEGGPSTPPTSGGQVVTGTNGLLNAQPYGSTGFYYTVGPNAGSPGTIDITSIGDIFNISLLWGSVDTYNTLQFLASDGVTVLASFVGNDIFNPANGNRTDPNTNPIVSFNVTGTDISNLSYLRLSSTQNAFEIDNIAFNSGVPEPATWGMMLLGFAGIGVAMRRRRRPALAQVA
jgi:hypothetical protein